MISDQHYLGYFLNGFKIKIQAQIHCHDTTDVYRTMTLACEVERKLSHA